MNGGKVVKKYDTLRKHTKRVRRQLSGEKAPDAGAPNPFQVKAFAAQFELQASKQKQTELKSQMEDLAQQSNAQTIELEKAKEKLRLMEEQLSVRIFNELAAKNLIFLTLLLQTVSCEGPGFCAVVLTLFVRRNKGKSAEEEAARKAAEEERKKAKQLEEQLKKMAAEKAELERQKAALKAEAARANEAESEYGSSGGGHTITRRGSGTKTALANAAAEAAAKMKSGKGDKGEKGEKGDSSNTHSTVNVTLQGQQAAPSHGPIIIREKDDSNAALLLQQQQAHIFALQEQRRLEAEARTAEERDRRRREREEDAKRKAEKKRNRALEEEKRRQSEKEAALLAQQERQRASADELRAKQEELERQMRLMRQRSGLEWFRNFYGLACKAQGVKENDSLLYLLQRAIKKNRSIYELDLFKTGLDPRGLQVITTAFRDTFAEIDKMTPELELVNTIDPTSVVLRGNNIKSGIAVVDLCVALGEVTVLDISANNLGPKFTSELAEALFNYKNLKTLRAGANAMGPVAGNHLLKSLHHQKALEVLDMGENGLTDKCATAMSELIELQPIKALTIQYNKFKESGMKTIIRAIANCSSLVELDLTQTGMDKRVKELMEILERRTSVRFLALGFNKLGSSFPKSWANFLANQQGIEEIDLRYARLGSRGARSCIEAIQVHSSGTITELVLNGNILDKKSTQVLLDLCHDSKSLKRLALRACGLKTDMMIAIANVVQVNTTLETLDVAGNSLKGKDGIAAFEQCLRLNTKLKAIGLAALKLDKRSIVPIARAVQFNVALEKVHVGSNKLGEDGVRELAENLAGNENLQTLVIQDVGATPRALLHLVQHLSTRSAIEVVDATDNELPRSKTLQDQLQQYPQIAVRI